MAMHMRPEERPGHNVAIRRTDYEQAGNHTPVSRVGCLGSQPRGQAPSRRAAAAVWGLRRPEAGFDPGHPGTLSRSGSDSRSIPEARTGAVMRAGRGHAGGCDESSGNAGREGICLPRLTAVAWPVGEPSAAAPRGPDIHTLPETAGLAVAGAGGATDRVRFPDPPSDVLRLSAGLAVEKVRRAMERVAFPDPPSATPDPGKTRKAASPNDPGKGRTGKSATPVGSPNDPGKGRTGKSVTPRRRRGLGRRATSRG
jgi:hypothetical protein